MAQTQLNSFRIMKKPQAALRFLILSEEFSKAAEQSLVTRFFRE